MTMDTGSQVMLFAYIVVLLFVGIGTLIARASVNGRRRPASHR